jgi:hypothetical protein
MEIKSMHHAKTKRQLTSGDRAASEQKVRNSHSDRVRQVRDVPLVPLVDIARVVMMFQSNADAS